MLLLAQIFIMNEKIIEKFFRMKKILYWKPENSKLNNLIEFILGRP